MNIENSKAQMRKGVLEYCILSIISIQEEVYPSDILTSLKSVELIVVEGTIYPLLNRLKNGGLLAYRWEESDSGPPRKYYRLTGEGQYFLGEMQKTWGNLSKAVKQITQKTKST